MQKVSAQLAPVFVTRSPLSKESRSRDLYEVVEFYAADHKPTTTALTGGGTYFGFNPVNALARFSSTSAQVFGASYARQLISRTNISRYLSSQFNDVTLTFSNVTRFFSAFVQANVVEGMWVVVRLCSRSLSQTLADSAVLLTGRADKPSDLNRGKCVIKVRQRIASIAQTVPYRKFRPECPLEFKGFGCLGNIPLGAHTTAYQTATACNKALLGNCTDYGNTDFNQGFPFVAEPGTFNYRTTQERRFLFIFRKKKTVIITGQYSSKDSTPVDTPVPIAIGRVRVEGIPVFGVDTGSHVRGNYVFSEGKIAAYLDYSTPTPGYTLNAVGEHLGDWGGTGTNSTVSGVSPHTGAKFSRTAYMETDFTGGKPETQDDLPVFVSTLLGMEMPIPNSVTGQYLAEGWSDNPADVARWWLTDTRILNQPAELINDDDAWQTHQDCDTVIIDDTGEMQKLVSSAGQAALASGQQVAYRPTANVNAGFWERVIGRVTLADQLRDETETTLWDDPTVNPPPDLVPRRAYRRRYTLNLYLTEEEKAHDTLFKTILPAFRGYLLYGPDGRIRIMSEKPANSCLLRGSTPVGATELPVDDVEGWELSAPVPTLTNYGAAVNGATASATSSYSGSFAPAYAVDSIRVPALAGAGWWMSAVAASPTAPQYLTSTFNSVRTITRVNVFTLSDDYAVGAAPTLSTPATLYGLTDFDIEYFDGTTWRLVPGGQVRGNALAWVSRDFPALTAQAVRVRALRSPDGYARIAELEAFDTAPRLQNTRRALVGVGLTTSETPTVVATRYSTVGNTITLGLATSGTTVLTRSGATFAGSDGAQAAASATIDVSGTPTVGEQIVVTIDGVAIPYNVEGTNTDSLAAMLASVINADRTIRRYVRAVWSQAAPNRVTLYSKLGFLQLERALTQAHSILEEIIEVQAVFGPENTLDGTFTWPQGDRQSTVNRIVIKYRDAGNDYQETELHVNDYDHQRLTGETNPYEIDGRGTDSYNQAYRLANAALAKLRDGDFFCAWSGGAGSALLDEGDVVCVNDRASGYINLPLRLEEVQISPRLDVMLNGRLYSTLMYSDEAAVQAIKMPSSLTALSVPPPPATGLALTETGGYNVDGSFNHRIRGTFTFPDYYASLYAEIQLKRPTDTAYLTVDRVTPAVGGITTFEIPNVDIGIHWVKVVVRNELDVPASAGNPEQSITISNPAPTTGVVLDTAPMRDADAGLFVYVGGRRDTAYSSALSWTGYRVWRNRGTGFWEKVAEITEPATIGVSQSVPTDSQAVTEDAVQSVSLTVQFPGGLTNFTAVATEAQVRGGTNNFVWGGERIGVLNIAPHATLPNTWVFTNIIRAMGHTTHALGTHVLYETVARIDGGLVALPADYFDVGRAVTYRLVTFGEDLASAPDISLTLAANSVRAHAVSNISLDADTASTVPGDKLIGFDGNPRPQEKPETYSVEVWRTASRSNPADLLRTLPVTPALTRLAALFTPSPTIAAGVQKNSVVWQNVTNGMQRAVAVQRIDGPGVVITCELDPGELQEAIWLRHEGLQDAILDPNQIGIFRDNSASSHSLRAYDSGEGTNLLTASSLTWAQVSGAGLKVRITISGTEVRWHILNTGTNDAPVFVGRHAPTYPLYLVCEVNTQGSAVKNVWIQGLHSAQTIYSERQQKADNAGALISPLNLRIYQNSTYPGIDRGFFRDVVLP